MSRFVLPGGAKLRRHATTLVLLVLAAVLGVYVVLDRGKIGDSERKARENDAFPAYRRQDVEKLELVRGAETLAFERRSGGDGGESYWQMTAPRDEPADDASVDHLLADFEFAGIVRRVDANASAGLDKPRLRGTITMGPLVVRFALGAPAGTPEGSAYFLVEGEPPCVVSRDFVNSLLKPADDYRTRTIVPYVSLDLARLEVRRPDGGFAIERMDDVSFRLHDEGVRASRDALDRVWSALGEMRAESFLPDAEADRLLGDPPRFVVTMKPKEANKPEGEIAVGGACPGRPEGVVVVRKKPTRLAACAPGGIVPGLSTTAAALVDKRLFAARSDEVAEMTIAGLPPASAAGGPTASTVEIARKGKGWHERKPEDRDLSGDEVDAANDLVSRMARAEGEEPSRGDPKDPFEARARVTLVRGEEHGEETIEIGPAEPSGVVRVRRLGDGATLAVPATAARVLLPRAVTLRGKQVFVPSIEAKMPRGLVVHCDGTNEELTREDALWSLVTPKGFPVDSTAAVDLANAVQRLSAEAWTADADDGTFGFDRARCSIALTFDDDAGPRTVAITLGDEVEGGNYAKIDGRSEVFVVGKALRDLATRWMIDRAIFGHDHGADYAVTLQAHGRRATFTRTNGRYVFPDGGVLEPGDKLVDTLDTLRADEVLHVGPPRPDEGFGSPLLTVVVTTSPDGGGTAIRVRIGQAVLVKKERMFFARADGVDATFAVGRDRIEPLLLWP